MSLNKLANLTLTKEQKEFFEKMYPSNWLQNGVPLGHLNQIVLGTRQSGKTSMMTTYFENHFKTSEKLSNQYLGRVFLNGSIIK